MTDQPDKSVGMVFLVGAGPGDPGMLTLRGKECLEQADIVLHDYLANPRLLQWAEQAETICLGKHGTGRLFSQEEINQKIVDLASTGKRVVRLKGGDPAIFARAHEELEILKKAGIPFEVVPGITAALAVTGTVGIPLTHRNFASAVALVTGQGKAGGPENPIDYAALAKFPGTIVFYMGTTTVETWSSELISAGMPPETPVVATRNCSLPTQSTFSCRLDEVTNRVNGEPKLRPPVLFVIGKSALDYGKYNWFENRPLFGKTILNSRPEAQSDALTRKLEGQGATVVSEPAIQIRPLTDKLVIENALNKLDQFKWIIFSSVNGVNYFMDHLMQHSDIRALANCSIAAIGSSTADQLTKFHLKADLIPREFHADVFADELKEKVIDQNVLLIRASRGREVLFEELSKTARMVEQLACYENCDVETIDHKLRERMGKGEIDIVTVSSSAIGKSLIHLFGDRLRKTALASISPVTSATLRELDFEPAIEASTYTMDGLVDAIVRYSGAG